LLHQLHILIEPLSDAINERAVCLVKVVFISVCWHNLLESTNQKLKDTVAEVAEVGKELVVVLSNEIRPEEDCVLVLRSVDK
jgi:hypothetical protein